MLAIKGIFLNSKTIEQSRIYEFIPPHYQLEELFMVLCVNYYYNFFYKHYLFHLPHNTNTEILNHDIFLIKFLSYRYILCRIATSNTDNMMRIRA